MIKNDSLTGLKFQPLTSGRWKDIEKLFGENGACGGCWCMWWKMKKSEFDKKKGEGNKIAFRKIIKSNEIPGIIAYYDKKPVGWCAVQPREFYSRFERSRILKPIDEKHVWSVVCFFIDKKFRRNGITIELLKAAVNHAKNKGAKIVEGYPTDPKKDMPAPFVYTGLSSAFLKAGFKEAARRSETRPIMRYYIKQR